MIRERTAIVLSVVVGTLLGGALRILADAFVAGGDAVAGLSASAIGGAILGSFLSIVTQPTLRPATATALVAGLAAFAVGAVVTQSGAMVVPILAELHLAAVLLTAAVACVATIAVRRRSASRGRQLR